MDKESCPWMDPFCIINKYLSFLSLGECIEPKTFGLNPQSIKINAKFPTDTRESAQLSFFFYLQQHNLTGQHSPTWPRFLLIFIFFQYMPNKNLWVAKQLLLITKVRWDKSHLKRFNDLLSRRSRGSASTWAQPHLLLHVIHHLELILSAPNTLWFSSSWHQGPLPRLSHSHIPCFCSSSYHCFSTMPENCISTW